MALYDGFFDAEYSNGSYDRTYNAAQHIEYYSYFIGSGVCIADNADSFKVTYSDRTATVAPGFLFINGYWLKNDVNYTIALPSSGTYAILAKLDTTNRLIYLTYQAVASSYSNALCLAAINIDAGTITDTRDDSTICGIIDSAGNTSAKAAYAKDYIDNTVESRLTTVEANVASAISEVEDAVDQIAEMANTMGYPAIGELKYSAGAPGSKWLPCDGRFVSVASYPDLVEALGYSEISEEITQLYSASSGIYLSNGVIYGNYLYFVNWSTKTMIGVSLTGGASRSISISGMIGDTTYFTTPSTSFPLCLSISNGYIFLSQHQRISTSYDNTNYNVTVAYGVFNASAGTISSVMTDYDTGAYAIDEYALTGTLRQQINDNIFPYITVSGGKWYYAAWAYSVSSGNYTYTYWRYISNSRLPGAGDQSSGYYSGYLADYLNVTSVVPEEAGKAFTSKNSGEWIKADIIRGSNSSGAKYYTIASSATASSVESFANGTYELNAVGSTTVSDYASFGSENPTIPVAGGSYIIAKAALTYSGKIPWLFSVNTSGGAFAAAYSENLGIPSTASIFPDSICYAKETFFIFVGTGLLITKDPADGDAIGYVSTTSVMGTITRLGYIGYDETNDQLVIYGINTYNQVKVFTVDLSDFVSTDTGVYLPTLTKGGLQGYIKALEG